MNNCAFQKESSPNPQKKGKVEKSLLETYKIL